MKTRLLALTLALALCFTAFAACSPKDDAAATPGGNTGPDAAPATDGGTAGGTSYKLGVNTWGSGVPILDSFGDAAEYAIKKLGSTTTRASDDFTADKELTNAQNFIGGGVDGMVFQAAAVTTLNQIAEEAKAAKVPFALHIFIGDDADRAAIADNNEYYVGAVDADMVLDGKLVAQYALADGCTKALIIGGNIGDNNMDQRIEGFKKEFEANGGKVLFEARCTDNSEAPQKAEDMLAANQDADCLYALVGDYVAGSLSAIDNLGRSDINFYMSCIDKESANYIKEGRIKGGNDGISLGSYIAPTLMLNYLDGHKILDANGKAPRFQTQPFKVTADNVDQYLSVFYSSDANVKPLSQGMLESLCFRTNPNVTYDTYVNFISNLTLDTMLTEYGLK
ncbi:MAG: substrate-binding domain-containing protein [Oscillospiraceae bacterium]|nr:substrate-binding domain-containing protein [Oscillospiraceae bacterium]